MRTLVRIPVVPALLIVHAAVVGIGCGKNGAAVLTGPSANDAATDADAPREPLDGGADSGLAPLDDFAASFGGVMYDYAFHVATDVVGNVYFAGAFTESVDFGGGALTSAGGDDIVLAKFDARGVHQWSRRFGGPGSDRGLAVAADANGRVFLTGFHGDLTSFGGDTFRGGQSTYLAAFDASGQHLWSKSFGSGQGSSVEVNRSGQVVMTGYFYGTTDFGGGSVTAPVTSSGTSATYLATYSASNGTHLWSKTFGSSEAVDLAVDGAGNLFVLTHFVGTVNFGGGPLASTGGGNGDVAVASYSEAGAFRWARRWGASANGSAVPASVALGSTGELYIAGSFLGTLYAGGQPLVSTGVSTDAFIAKYDGSGNHLWSKRFGDQTGSDSIVSIAVDAASNLVFCGWTWGPMDFGGGALAFSGVSDAVMGSFASGGAHRWSQSLGRTGEDSARALALGSGGAVWVVGQFEGAVTVAGRELTSLGRQDVFVLRTSR